MNTTTILINRRLLQTADLDTFNDITPTSVSPTTAAAAVTRPFNTTGPFDSSMAITILALLAALFFMAFFSIYLRRFSSSGVGDQYSADPHHRDPPSKARNGGLDPSAINSLPLVAYDKPAKHRMIVDCPICLGEFQEREWVKLIPYCGHVFHPTCVDTWLSSHVTCPLCRSAQLFKGVEEVCLDVAQDRSDIRADDVGVAWNVGDDDTWMGVGSSEMRRSRSCCILRNDRVLRRSKSF